MPKKNTSLLSILLILTVLVSSCNMPGSNPEVEESRDDVLTAVAQTVESETGQETPAGEETPQPEATATSEADSEETAQAPDTETPAPTATEEAEPTATEQPCNAAEFVKDVTIPDGKDFSPGDVFTKTWRLKNVGSCAWTSGYDLVFSGGDAMGGPSAQQLTADAVEPGETVDISVDLTAPASAGTYRGNWELRDPSGTKFGIENSSAGVFWVEIEVIVPTDTPEPTNTPMVVITINPTLILNPFVKLKPISKGMVEEGQAPRTNANNIGDTSNDNGIQGFLTFDLNGIPDDATIVSAKLVPTSSDTLGEPFQDLGYLRGYIDNYGNLDTSDYTNPPVIGAILRIGSYNKMVNDSAEQSFSESGINGLQDALAGDIFQMRLQFNGEETNNDGEADMVRAKFQLVITYQNP